MKRVVLISCVSKKREEKAKAKDLYESALFKFNYQYALSMQPDKIFILSAKYGLLNEDNEIEPYDETLNTKSAAEIRDWAEKVLADLKKEVDVDKDEMIFLAGDKYRKYLLPHLKNYKIPLKGLPIGKQLQFLKEATKHE
ncbi:MAG: hypothetical protein LRY73_07600 [Bacillus sp. (in: Bacteria)]|nr:hypothetical protein [Bacillus sp. (in: firmicutes)]